MVAGPASTRQFPSSPFQVQIGALASPVQLLVSEAILPLSYTFGADLGVTATGSLSLPLGPRDWAHWQMAICPELVFACLHREHMNTSILRQ